MHAAGPPDRAPRAPTSSTQGYGDPRAILARTGDRVADVLERVRAAAPDARVVLVGYPRMVSVDEPCRAMPLAPGDRVWLARVEKQLNQTLRRAARVADVGFADLHRASAGHEICSDDPWVNGRRTDPARALAFHPFAEGQAAVADVLLALLAEGPSTGPTSPRSSSGG